MSLNLADGQLAATSTTILGATGTPRSVAVTLFNTASGDQTVSLTVTRSGSTARTVVRGVLEQYETMYVSGLGLDPTDILAGSATDATSVDYLASVSSDDGPFTVSIRDADGAIKGGASVLDQLAIAEILS